MQLGRGFCELANYEYDYLGRALDGKPDLSYRCHLTLFLAPASDLGLGTLTLLLVTESYE